MDIENILNKSLPGKVLLPGSELYETSNNSYWTVFGSSLKPSFIVQPTNTTEVSTLLKELSSLFQQQPIRVAVRGTGHTPFTGSANIADGVTIDLRGLRGIQLNEDKSIVDICVGETWSSVYEELEKYGLTVAGGRVGRVGVGGLVLGGGLSFFSNRRGFACDSVTEFEVVLASGEVVQANQETNAALWTALKGGLNNFGIVTSFKMRTFESGKIWGGVAYYMPDTFSQLINATVDFVNDGSDKDTHVMSSAGYGQGQHIVVACMYQTKGVVDAPSLKRFTSLPGRIEQYSSLRTSTHIDFYNELSNFVQDGVRSFYATITIRPDVPLMNEIHQVWLEVVESLKDADGFIFSLNYSLLPKSLLLSSQESGGNAKDIDPEDGPLIIVFLNPTWNSQSDDKRIQKGVEQLLARCKTMAAEQGMLHRYIFTNYAYYKDDVFRGYSDKSWVALGQTSRKFDPAGFFQQAVPGGFKLSTSDRSDATN